MIILHKTSPGWFRTVKSRNDNISMTLERNRYFVPMKSSHYISLKHQPRNRNYDDIAGLNPNLNLRWNGEFPAWIKTRTMRFDIETLVRWKLSSPEFWAWSWVIGRTCNGEWNHTTQLVVISIVIGWSIHTLNTTCWELNFWVVESYGWIKSQIITYVGCTCGFCHWEIFFVTRS